MKRMIAAGILVALAGTQAHAADPASCQSPKVSDVGWTDITITTAASTMILEAIGYKPETQILSVAVTFESLKKGNTDFFLGNWMPLQTPQQKPLVDSGAIEVVRANLEGAKIGLAVPRTTFDKGLKTYSDIAKFKDDLGGKIYSIEAGSGANATLLGMIEGDKFGLGGFELVESSEQGMLAQVQRAVSAGDDIVFFGWRPHPMNVRYEMDFLTDGEDSFGPDDGMASVLTDTRPGLTADCPNLGQFLKNLAFTVDAEDLMMSYVLDEGLEPRAAATRWLKDNPEVLDGWLEGVVTTDDAPALPAAKEALGL